ncbi:hypothetical protein SCHPADRAFT_879154 [Schizopora paradoxa]|uniref:WW domain-containing protein n=1 Tax=Schizopora paradoxa TaxID=27342 RepID=A0A0H2RD03_9AGAM|nr:hypothetical protein SCHPADRAFT_879154 [Schizopora paradoxa]
MAALSPLPSGWTEHIAPGGQPYFFNASTNESTYIRPLPSFPLPPQPNAPNDPKKQKKEKPKVKTPISGTPWLRVTTTVGNVFYTNTEKKESVWTVPEEIKDAVEVLEAKETATGVTRVDREAKKEIERVKREVKRKLDEGPVPLDEVDISQKRAKVEEEDEEGEDDDDEEEEEEEEWQREAAAQLAAEAEEEERRKREEEEDAKRKEKEEQEEFQRKAKALNMPARVDLSVDEAKALFKTLLREKEINPLLPWDTVLPLFITDPRYVLLSSVNARRDAFDEYCRDRVREIRAAKLAAEAAPADTPSGSTQLSPKEEFEKLLKEEVKSTRTSWTEWRRTWKSNRRFYGWGRDDRERERRFREWLKELGEEKRKAAEKAERDFFTLLKEKAHIKPGSIWKDVKRGLDKDPRYDAVGSSSLREELFNTYVKTLGSSEPSASPSRDTAPSESGPSNTDDKKKRDKERKERAVREREAQVRRERERLEREVDRSKTAMSREEGELEFLSMLTDAIREPLASWDSACSSLQNDPRFTQSPLPVGFQRKLFNQHVQALREKQLTALHALFEAHAPSLADKFDSLPERSIRTSVPATKLGMGLDRDIKARALLEDEFARWQRLRRQDAERAFGVMLSENAFVAFWGRVQKMALDKERKEQEREGANGMHVDVDDEDLIGEEAGADGEERASLQKLAKGIHVEEIKRVLKNDKRYAMFDHMPEQREKWIKARQDHLENLAAPQLSVHVHQ